MLELTQLLPSWFTTLIGVGVIYLFGGIAKDWLQVKFSPKRRSGSRSGDDIQIDHLVRSEWVDRLIAVMNSNADVNIKVAETLTKVLANQDLVMETLRIAQLEHHGFWEKMEKCPVNNPKVDV